MRTTAELSGGCASTGWLRAVVGGSTRAVAQMGEAAWKEALCEPGHRIALELWVSDPAAERVSGGYRLRQLPGRFSSSIDHARWILAGLDIESTEPGWAAEPHVVLIPVEDVTVLDGWHTFGLRGTGSRSFVIGEACAPGHRVLPQSELDPLTAVRPRPAGAVFRMVCTAIGTVALSAVPLGTAWPPSICTPGPAGIAPPWTYPSYPGPSTGGSPAAGLPSPARPVVLAGGTREERVRIRRDIA